MKKLDIKEIMAYFSKTENITYMRLKQDDVEVELEKGLRQTEHVVPPAPAKVQKPKEKVEKVVENTPNLEALCIKSPMVGTFYQAPSPGAKPFAKVGDKISKGQPVAIIEAMKIMNEIEAEYDCEIKKILIEDGQAVEFDMPLFEVEKI